MTQLSFFKRVAPYFGGILSPSVEQRRKTARPLTRKKSIHLVLKTVPTDFKNKLNRQRDSTSIEKINLRTLSQDLTDMINKYSDLFSIKIYNFSIQRDHIHFVIKISSRENYKKFIRSLTGVAARLFKIKWLSLPFTRIIEWGKSFASVINYVHQNELEALGVIAYQIRKSRYVKNHRY